ncbi:MAG: septal ring lytic transglycosylase RlpA family protein [Nitrospira sp.]|nr:septal ring lytic transglycosylase RlpA family protein [Nitrospira sp.]
MVKELEFRTPQRRSHALPIVAVLACLSLGACSWIPKGESALDVGIKERGIASWYGAQFHGRQAANGEIFNMEAMTAAHRTLPLGSMVRVVNLLNGKHVRVRINDRGPYVNGRILDLSRAAAVQLGMVDKGLSVIQLEVIGDHRPEFVFDAEEGGSPSTTLLTVRTVDEPLNHAVLFPNVDRMGSKSTAVRRLLPHDIVLQRRWKWTTAVFSTDPAHQTHTALVLT